MRLTAEPSQRDLVDAHYRKEIIGANILIGSQLPMIDLKPVGFGLLASLLRKGNEPKTWKEGRRKLADEKLMNAVKEGGKYRDIANRTGFSIPFVFRKMKSKNIEPMEHGRKINDSLNILKACIRLRSRKAVSKELKLYPGTISEHLKKYGLSIKSNGKLMIRDRELFDKQSKLKLLEDGTIEILDNE